MRYLAATILATAAGLAGARTPPTPPPPPPVSRTVMLESAAGTPAGRVTFTAAPRGVVLKVEATGLTPGWHGIHIHMMGDCSDAAMGFKKSGGHVHGDETSIHGLLNPAMTDTGDLPNIHAGQDGTAMAQIYTAALTMGQIADADGSAVVIHASPDDYTTQPIGGAGARVACAVVK